MIQAASITQGWRGAEWGYGSSHSEQWCVEADKRLPVSQSAVFFLHQKMLSYLEVSWARLMVKEICKDFAFITWPLTNLLRKNKNGHGDLNKRLCFINSSLYWLAQICHKYLHSSRRHLLYEGVCASFTKKQEENKW